MDDQFHFLQYVQNSNLDSIIKKIQWSKLMQRSMNLQSPNNVKMVKGMKLY